MTCSVQSRAASVLSTPPNLQPLFLLLLLLPCLLAQLASAQMSPLVCHLLDDAVYGTILRASQDPGDPAPCLLSQLTQRSPGGPQSSYGIISEGQRIPDYFGVRAKDSALIARQAVDLEALCSAADACCDKRAPVCLVTLKIAMTSIGSDGSQGTQLGEVLVRIHDRNDHRPSFGRSIFSISVREDSEPGTLIDLPPATDQDTMQFSIDRYELRPTIGAFELLQPSMDASSGHPTAGLKLKQMTNLDRELEANYSFVLFAYDRGSPPLTGSVSILVKVDDVNDHRPSFQQKVYRAAVNETARRGEQVVCVRATDSDEGLNAKISYRVSPMSHPHVLRDFGLNSLTGCLTLRSELDYEKQKAYSFTVVAQDEGSSPKSDEAQVQIEVLDANDNDPKVHVQYLLTNGNQPAILENREPSDSDRSGVAVVSVKDSDTGAGGQVTCQAEPADQSQPTRSATASQPDAVRFRLQLVRDDGVGTQSMMLMLNGSLDREQRPYEIFQICCSDHGLPPRSQCLRQSVKILDVNDETPTFDQTVYHATITEGLPLHSLVAQVRATDKDEDPNNRLTYTIDKEAQDFFYINNATGTIKSLVQFDRETRKEFSIVVTAEDRGKLKSSASVSVSVRDVNDEVPRLSQPAGYVFRIDEECPLDTLIGQVKAEDSDEGEFGRLRFGLLPGRESLNFRVSPENGQIFTRQRLDRERQAVHELRVLVVDNPGGVGIQHSVTASVRVELVDINDNEPSVQFPTADNNTFVLSYQEQVNQHFLQVRASDPDEGPNGLLHFDLVQATQGGEKLGLFYIDPSDGAIKVNRKMTLSDIGKHQLTVRVTDSGSPTPKSRQVQLIVDVDKSPARHFDPPLPPSSGGGSFAPGSSDGVGGSGSGSGGGGGGQGFGGRGLYPPGGASAAGSSGLLVAAVGVACALTLLLLAVALCVCQRRGILAEVLGLPAARRRQHHHQLRGRGGRSSAGSARKLEAAGAGGVGGGVGGQLESLAFLGAAAAGGGGGGASSVASGGGLRHGDAREKTFPSVTSSLNQSAATAVTFDEMSAAAAYVTCSGGTHMLQQRRVSRPMTGTMKSMTAKEAAMTDCVATASRQHRQQQPQLQLQQLHHHHRHQGKLPSSNYEEALSCSNSKPPTYYDLEGQQQHQQYPITRLMHRCESAGSLLSPAAASTTTVASSVPPRTDHVTRRRPEDQQQQHQLSSRQYDLFEAGLGPGGQTLNHQGKLYSIPKASYV